VTLQRFEDIAAWQKARELARAVYEVTAVDPFRHDFALRDQIRRAVVSIVSNIAEGFERGGNREFAHFLAIAKGSSGEVKAQLYIALDAGFLQREEFDRLYGLATETGRLIGGFMRYLQQTDMKGSRFPVARPIKGPQPGTRNSELGTDR